MDADIIIIGAGAAGLMAARELGRAGKKVIILEARDRIGGRIMPLPEDEFGYPAQGGAEWVHGEAPITKALAKEAGLPLIENEGEIWSVMGGKLQQVHDLFLENESLHEKLRALKEDISIADFLEQNFPDKKDEEMKRSIVRLVQGYDAADQNQVSTFSLRDEWLSDQEWSNFRIKGGYTALLKFLALECKKYDVITLCNSRVTAIHFESSDIHIHTADGLIYVTPKCVITIALPMLQDITCDPGLTQKMGLAQKIGFGHVIKVLLKFKSRWWEQLEGEDLSKMTYLLSYEKFTSWWTQYPDKVPVLTGWMGGPDAALCKDKTTEEILDMALTSLSTMVKIDKTALSKEIVLSKVMNWPADPFTRGAYSYTTVETKDAYQKLAEPYGNVIFFAGEALYKGKVTATVEGALGSGLETAQRILKNS